MSHPRVSSSSPIEGQAGPSQLHCETPHLHHHSWNPTVNSTKESAGAKAKVNFHNGLVPWSGSWLLHWLSEDLAPCSAGEGKPTWRQEGSRNPVTCHCHKMPHTMDPQPKVPVSRKSNLLKRCLTNIKENESGHPVLAGLNVAPWCTTAYCCVWLTGKESFHL